MNTHTPSPRIWPRITALLVIPVLMLGLAFIFIALAASPQDFSHPHNLSRTANTGQGLDSGRPAMAVYSSTLAVVWSDQLSNTTINDIVGDMGHLYLKTASEQDGYWRPRVQVHTATINALATDPDIVFDRANPNKVHLVWTEAKFNTQTQGDFLFQKIKYTTCDVAGDFNTCETPQLVADTTGGGIAFRNPAIAQDDQNNLHVVWAYLSAGNDAIYYSRGVVGSSVITWSAASKVLRTSNGKDPQLTFANGRLHLAWDDEGNDAIKYQYDAMYTNDVFTATDELNAPKTWAGDKFSTYNGGDPGNLSMINLGNMVFIAFDIQSPGNPDTYALVYVRSTFNGDLDKWSNPRSIPEQDVGNFNGFSSSTSPPTLGLKPSLAITHSGAITWLHATWQRADPELGLFNIYYAYRVVTTSVGFDAPWQPQPPLTVTGVVPEPPLPSETIVTAPDAGFKLLGADTDSAAPAFAITDPATGGLGKLHVAYLEQSFASSRWDVHYRGFIAGTIDPDYIKQSVKLVKTVDPGLIITNNLSLPPQDLLYNIYVSNLSDQDHNAINAIGVGITDTLPNKITTVTNLSANAGTAAYNAGQNVITWTGTVSADFTVIISFTGTTIDLLPLNAIITNKADLWNIGSRGEKILGASATTRVVQSVVFLPIIVKN
ncbi:MAG: hypothetical protein ACE5G8_00165 [Anaerolineae bacterium]